MGREADEIAQDLIACERQRDALDLLYTSLRNEFLDAVIPNKRMQAEGVSVKLVRRAHYRDHDLAMHLASKGFFHVLRPNHEAVEKLASHGYLDIAEILKFVTHTTIGYRLEFAYKKPPKPTGTDAQDIVDADARAG